MDTMKDILWANSEDEKVLTSAQYALLSILDDEIFY